MKQTIDDVDRRTVLRGVGTVAAAGMLAGCGGGGGDGNGNGNGNGDGNDDGNGGGGVPSEVSDYLDGANNFDGSVVDETGSSSVTVEVGAGDDGYAFDPAAVRIATGTTVTWEWTGRGSTHNVIAEDGAFDSGSAVAEEGHTFEHAFESAGTYLYFCRPHRTLGMKGAVVVE